MSSINSKLRGSLDDQGQGYRYNGDRRCDGLCKLFRILSTIYRTCRNKFDKNTQERNVDVLRDSPGLHNQLKETIRNLVNYLLLSGHLSFFRCWW